MAASRKKTITISLSENELAELDRIREEYKTTRSQALREALRSYLAAMRSLPAPEEPSPDELEALREARRGVRSRRRTGVARRAAWLGTLYYAIGLSAPSRGCRPAIRSE
jgi:ferric-dicitrate binding protein FerR (iron transport regulator)